jgi:hypothetical protein
VRLTLKQNRFILLAVLLLAVGFVAGYLVGGSLAAQVYVDAPADIETLGKSHFDQLNVAGAATFLSAIDAQAALYDSGGAFQIDDTAIELGDLSGTGNNTTWELDDGGQVITVTAYTLDASQVSDFLRRLPVYAKNADYTVDSGQTGVWFVNKYATGSVTFSLPAAGKGYEFCFYVFEAQQVYVDPATGDQIFDLTNASGDRIGSSTAGDFVCLLGLDGSNWLPLGSSGTWADAD